VADIGLQAVQRQDDTALAFQHPPQPPHPGQGRGQELVAAVEQIGHAALGDVDPAIPQRGVDLGHAAVVAVAQRAHSSTPTRAMMSRPNSCCGSASAPSASGRKGMWKREQPGASQRRIRRRSRTAPESVTRPRRFS
jgi:hypothetical protein